MKDMEKLDKCRASAISDADTAGKIHITVPIVVEGRYDKAKLSSLTDAVILTTDGFGIFKNAERTALIRRLAKNGIILLCDSDGAGGVIRSHLKGCLNGVTVYNLYTEQIRGVEKRKSAPSKEGFLGVEGIPAEKLRALLEKLLEVHPELGSGDAASAAKPMTKADLYALGLTGGADSSVRRDRVCAAYHLPKGMTPNALLAALNMITSRDELEAVCAGEDAF